MAVLCIDTATDALVVGLVDGLASARLLAGVTRSDVRAQALLSLVEACCHDAGIERSSIELVVIGSGPGAFTGLRIGIAAARGIAIELGVPLIGVPTAAAIAAPTLLGDATQVRAPEAPGHVIAVIDARRGEHFRQRVRRGDAAAREPDVVLDGDLEVVPAASIDEGTGATAAEESTGSGCVVGPTSPGAVGLALAARGRPALDPREVHPTYGREPDAAPRPTAGVVAPSRGRGAEGAR